MKTELYNDNFQNYKRVCRYCEYAVCENEKSQYCACDKMNDCSECEEFWNSEYKKEEEE